MPKQTLDGVLPNAGVEARFNRKLQAIVNGLNASVIKEIVPFYDMTDPKVAADAMPMTELKAAFRRVTRLWTKKLNEIAPDAGKQATQDALKASDSSFMASLRKAGFTVKFQFTRSMQEAFSATVEQNVGLIKSIGSEYLSDVQGDVMRSVAAGRDLGGLSETLKKRYQITQRRAELIATHQNNLATATFNRLRMLEAGFKTCIWQHSQAGNHPRLSHVAAKGREYNIEKGCWIDEEFIQPMEKIGCKCFGKPVIPGLKRKAE